MTRDLVQGFIDGYLESGGDPSKIKKALSDWMENHHTYPQDEQNRAIILSDLDSYKGV